ncbi:MAG: hypothetical protein CEE40_02115 [Chloroflexi bacterium B3_Chlor]|nr:MAG: hypothetical protein CEE40_02115 [Chloroflexi bacterium B3_Chlor]
MVNPSAAKRLRYEKTLQAIGRLAEKQRLREICILEVEGGVVLQGQALVTTRDGYHLVSKTKVLSHEDLAQLMREL